MGRHISDTHIIHREIYYVHLQYGCMVFVDTLCWVAAGHPALATAAANTCMLKSIIKI